MCSQAGTSGGHTPGNKTNVDEIKAHIQKYHPIKHHYRYEHAPHRYYLPADVTITAMHSDFLQDPDLPACTFETCRKVLREMNIGFTTLSKEECSRCSIHLQHIIEQHGVASKEPNYHQHGCDQCDRHQHHVSEAKMAREAYRKDADSSWEQGTMCLSADMMRVFMLPQLPLKGAVFTPRLTCFNVTFALLMLSRREDRAARKRQQVSTCIIWHDALAGRGCEEVAATFYLFLTTVCRDVENVVLWLDNFAGQNKSWTLMSTLLKVAHSTATRMQTVTLKFLEPGHTSISADAIHQVISKKPSKGCQGGRPAGLRNGNRRRWCKSCGHETRHQHDSDRGLHQPACIEGAGR